MKKMVRAKKRGKRTSKNKKKQESSSDESSSEDSSYEATSESSSSSESSDPTPVKKKPARKKQQRKPKPKMPALNEDYAMSPPASPQAFMPVMERSRQGDTIEFDSVTTGCFYVPPTQGAVPFNTHSGFVPIYDGEKPESVTKRWEAFDQTWRKMEGEVKKIVQGMNSHVYKNLAEFCGDTSSVKAARELPAALMFCGVNVSDHNLHFSQLRNDLTKVSTLVARIQSASCRKLEQGVDALIRSLLDSAIETQARKYKRQKNHHKRLEKARKELSIPPKKLSGSGPIMKRFQNWYQDYCRDILHKTSETCVVLIEDFEGVPNHVLTGLIELMYSMRFNDERPIPMVLVMGVATSADSVLQNLSYDVTKKLWFQDFRVARSRTVLTQVLQKLFVNHKCPVQFGPKIINMLRDQFFTNDMSVASLTRALKFIFMEFFDQRPFSYLCAQPLDESIKLFKADLTVLTDKSRHFGSIKAQPYAGQLKGRSDGSFRPTTSDRKLMNKWRGDFIKARDEFPKALPCFGSWIRLVLKDYAKEADIYWYAMLMEKTAAECRELDNLWKFLKGANPKDLKHRVLQPWIEILSGRCEAADWGTKEAKAPCYHEFREEAERLSKQAEEAILKGREAHQKLQKEVREQENRPAKKAKSSALDLLNRKPVNRRAQRLATGKKARRRQLGVSAAGKKIWSPEVAQLQQAVMKYFKSFLDQNLRPLKKYPLHEIFYFDDATNLKGTMLSEPQKTMTKVLRNPDIHLGCMESNEAMDEGCEEEDLSIMFQKYEEMGRFINTHDFFSAFKALRLADLYMEQMPDEGPWPQALEQEAQVRFRMGLQGLEHMGFIKPTTVRKDHLAKKVFGVY